ncbi:MAG: hypothetical protein HW387_1683 [Parachlamydiales bacterium]|nr:hypothetical protein [Parachlamydiales bacterium]
MKAIGIQIDGPYLRGAAVQLTRQNLAIIDLKTSPISHPKVKPLYTERDSGVLISGLSSKDLIIRNHPITLNSTDDLRRALILQTEAQLHLNPDELITIAQIKVREKNAITYSTTRSALAAHLQSFNDMNLDPERVGAIPSALQSFIRWKAPDISSYFLVDISQTSIHCIWVENDAIQKAHSHLVGWQPLIRAFQEDRKKLLSIREQTEIDFSFLKTNQYPALTEEARSLRRDLSKIIHSFQCQRPLIFTGTNANGFREYLLEILQNGIVEEKKLGLSIDEQLYAQSIGLAIDYLTNRKQPIQFRSTAMLSKRTWQKMGFISASLLSASILFSALFWKAGSWWMDKREAEIIHHLETWSAAKDPALRNELFLNGSDTQSLAAQWMKLIEKNSKDYRFIMKAPKVAQFLAELTHHSLVESLRMSSDPISFEQIHYQLVSCPRIEALADPYLVKIDLEFKVASPLHARKFHEALLQGTQWIDTSREITWDMTGDLYKTSFYLKNL